MHRVEDVDNTTSVAELDKGGPSPQRPRGFMSFALAARAWAGDPVGPGVTIPSALPGET
jgi:hypothetical protein